jgi:hypothetical protein
MEYDYARAHAQTWNPQPQGAEAIREASLRNKADEANSYLQSAHALMDELEDALHGPETRPETPPIPTDRGHPGLRIVLSSNSERAASLVGRLQTLIGSL